MSNDNWISVEDRLPSKSDYYLISWWMANGIVGEGYFDVETRQWALPVYGDGKDYDQMDDPAVTHWQPLPAPPENKVEL